MFDANQFLDMTVEGSNSTTSLPIPVGEFPAQITEAKARQWVSKEDPSKTGIAVDVIWEIQDEGVKAALERQKVTVKQGIMLDLTEAGGIDMGKGKNVTLGRLREAVGLNEPGRPFAFSMLVGRMAKISVSQRPDGDKIYNDVKAVTRL